MDNPKKLQVFCVIIVSSAAARRMTGLGYKKNSDQEVF